MTKLYTVDANHYWKFVPSLFIVGTLTMPDNYKRQYFIANRIIVVTLYVIKVFGLWPYKLQFSTTQRMEYSAVSIIYSVFAPIFFISAYVFIGAEIYTEKPKGYLVKIFSSVPLQLISLLYSYLLIISYVSVYISQPLQYGRKRIAYFKCKNVVNCMRAYRTEYINIREFLIKFLLKTIVYDILNFLLFFHHMIWTSTKVQSEPYWTILVYLPVFAIRLSTNVFYGGLLFFNVLYKELNESLSKIFVVQNSRHIHAAEFEKFSMLYFELAKAMRAFNSIFSVQVTLWISTQLLTLTVQCFYQYVAVVQLILVKESYFHTDNVSMLLAIIASMYEIFTTAHACNSLVKEVKIVTWIPILEFFRAINILEAS